MRIFAISDLHVDHVPNARWLLELSQQDYKSDILVFAGDLTHDPGLFEKSLDLLLRKFAQVHYLPGNHDLWVPQNQGTSLDKFYQQQETAILMGAHTRPYSYPEVHIRPLLSWYDYSFGQPDAKLLERWSDFSFCRWPENSTLASITEFFLKQNLPLHTPADRPVISFSHFLPRLDTLPRAIDPREYFLSPVLGTQGLREQVDQLRPAVHVFGHSHINVDLVLDGTRYLNNAFGYPKETHCRKDLVQIEL